MPSRAEELCPDPTPPCKDCVCLCVCVRERESNLIYKLVFVRNERNIVFLCTKNLMMLTADNTLQSLIG